MAGGGHAYFGGRKKKTEEEADEDYVPNLKQAHKKTSDASEDPQEDIDMREWNNMQDQLETSDEEPEENDGKEEHRFEEDLISIVEEPSQENPENGNRSPNWKEGCTFKCKMCAFTATLR